MEQGVFLTATRQNLELRALRTDGRGAPSLNSEGLAASARSAVRNFYLGGRELVRLRFKALGGDVTVVPFFVCGVLKLRILLFVRLGGECLMLVSARIAVRKQCWEVRRELTVRLRPT